ncbi:hypothetical protein [uncultured Shewanella sp.]|uniref:hypothetical protein n=1 Tax=uncultured Shewanella sp. TaxID=173975 RepID=UPI0026067F5B|nr:hypothetical protein [uncultured Shewanella sp.]
MDVIINIVCLIIGGLSVYFTAYLKVKGKNKGLIEDINKLEDEKQKVIAKYRAETEEIKKQHSLDIEKRKYQYEDKRLQFSKYFSLLDEFHSKCNAIFLEKFQPIMAEFLAGYLEDDESIKNKAIVKYNEDVQALVFELNEEHLKIKSEQNSIRLISSPEVDTLLDNLEVAVKNATNSSTEMLKVMATQEFWADQTIITPYQETLTVHGQEVQKSHNVLKEQMKVELNEI